MPAYGDSRAAETFLMHIPRIIQHPPQAVAAHAMRVVMEGCLGFRRVCFDPAPRNVAAGFFWYPNHLLERASRDLSTDLRASSYVDADIVSGQEVIAR